MFRLLGYETKPVHDDHVASALAWVGIDAYDEVSLFVAREDVVQGWVEGVRIKKCRSAINSRFIRDDHRLSWGMW